MRTLSCRKVKEQSKQNETRMLILIFDEFNFNSDDDDDYDAYKRNKLIFEKQKKVLFIYNKIFKNDAGVMK